MALLTSTRWLDEALDQFRWLVVGLLDEQIGAVQVVPESLPDADALAFGKRVAWRETSLAPLRTWRLKRLAPKLRELNVNVIHVFDTTMWPGAMQLGRAMDVPVVFAVSGKFDVEYARRLLKRDRPCPIAFTATTRPLRKALADLAGDTAPVQLVPPGVHLPSAPAPGPEGGDEERTLCAVVTGTRHCDADYESLLKAMQKIVLHHPSVHFFVDCMGQDTHELWQAVSRHRLFANVSLVPRRLGHREILLRADVIIQPQALGRSRCFVLKAMAAGLTVIARTDPWLDYLVQDETAWLVDRVGARQWELLIERAITSPDDRKALGEQAREWISQRYVAAKEVAQTLSLYRRVTGEAFRFPDAPGTDQEKGKGA